MSTNLQESYSAEYESTIEAGDGYSPEAPEDITYPPKTPEDWTPEAPNA